MRILLDTNVIISALVARGLCHSLFEFCIENHEILISPFIINESRRVLKEKFKAKEPLIMSFEHTIREFFTVVSDSCTLDLCRDKDDNNVLSVAVKNNAIYLITGDDDLLNLGQVENTQILSPRDFLDKQRSNSEEIE